MIMDISEGYRSSQRDYSDLLQWICDWTAACLDNGQICCYNLRCIWTTPFSPMYYYVNDFNGFSKPFFCDHIVSAYFKLNQYFPGSSAPKLTVFKVLYKDRSHQNHSVHSWHPSSQHPTTHTNLANSGVFLVSIVSSCLASCCSRSSPVSVMST